MTKDTQEAAATTGGTVGQMPVGLAGALELGKTSGVGAVVVGLLWWMMESMQTEQGRRLDTIEAQITQVQADTKSVQSELADLRGDIREITVRQQLSEEERRRASTPSPK